jgi:hypothetical protein
MGLLDRIFKKTKNKTNLLDNAPFLCPWYFDKTKPTILKNNQLLKWVYVDKIGDNYVGALTLQDNRGDILGVLNAYTYVLLNPTSDKFLIWTREWKEKIGFPKVTIELFKTADLKPIEDYQKIILEMGDYRESSYHLNASPSDRIEFTLNPDSPIKISFGELFQEFGDFCLINEIPGLYKDGQDSWHNTAITYVNIKSGYAFVYPQDWFNKDESVDFGYQWLTRAIKDPTTNLIHGQGIRLDDFILNETNIGRV